MRYLKIAGLLAILMTLSLSQALAGDLVVRPGIGVKAGVNVSTVEIAGEGTSSRTGFTGGGFVKLPMNQMTLQLEALYSQKGFNKNEFKDIQNWEVEMDYIELPVVLNVEIPMEQFDPYFYGGVSFGILTSANEKNADTNGQSVDISEYLSNTTWDLVLGFGFRKHGLSLDFRFNKGLTKLNDVSYNSMETYEMKDSTLSFTASYAIWK